MTDLIRINHPPIKKFLFSHCREPSMHVWLDVKPIPLSKIIPWSVPSSVSRSTCFLTLRTRYIPLSPHPPIFVTLTGSLPRLINLSAGELWCGCPRLAAFLSTSHFLIFFTPSKYYYSFLCYNFYYS